MDPPLEFLKKHAITIAATNSALCSILAGYPFDSIKTRMQAYRYQSTWTCISSTYKLEGLRGFYRGVVPLLATSTFLRAVSWNLYSTNKEQYQKFFRQHGIEGVTIPCIFGGMSTGLVMSLFGAPIEFIKVQRQLQKVTSTNRNLMQWIRHIIATKGTLLLTRHLWFVFGISISCACGYSGDWILFRGL
jgi:hypothetical protein